MSDRRILNFWRGPRAAFNALALKDYYTQYSVLEPNGAWTVYYGGYNAFEGGEKLPVQSIIAAEDIDSIANVAGRFLVESGNGYSIVIHAASGETMTEQIDPFPLNYCSVRVIDKGMKAYVYTDLYNESHTRELVTYDESDAGSWS